MSLHLCAPLSGDACVHVGVQVQVKPLSWGDTTAATRLLHQLYPFVVTIAEDVSGMPTLCRSVAEGGIGFDYRLAMAIPDMWIKLLKEQSDELARSRRFHVLNGMKHIWKNYKEKAFGADELHPVSGTTSQNWGGMGTT